MSRSTQFTYEVGMEGAERERVLCETAFGSRLK